MKHQYVETSNHQRFMEGVTAVENRGSPEACILLLTGDPGTGKTAAVHRFGSDRMACRLEGVPGMSLAYLRDYIADQTGVHGKSKYHQHAGFEAYFRDTGAPIILDEAQHGLPDKGAVIEYLRRLAEKAGVLLVLVCHTSEKHRFAEDRLAHIATRISAVVNLRPATVDDCGKYLAELCDVPCAPDLAAVVHAQSRGRYRLLANATRMVEAIARTKKLDRVCAADIGRAPLCEDVMKPGAK
ncbi:MAG: AAA family ATPase [Pseudomonadota bacterium]